MKVFKGLLLAAVMGLACIFMTGCGYDDKQGFTTDSPEEVASKFLSAMKNCNFPEMRKYATGQKLSQINDLEREYNVASADERELVRNLLGLAGLVSVQSSSKTDSFWADGEERCNVTVKALDGSTTTIKMKRKDIFSPWYVEDM